jgi:hypothetical protein
LVEPGVVLPVERLRNRHRLILQGEPDPGWTGKHSDPFVALVGWAVTEGHFRKNRRTVEIAQKDGTPACEEIRGLLAAMDARWHEYRGGVGMRIRYFGLSGAVAEEIRAVAPGRVMTRQFVLGLGSSQRMLLLDVMMRADGSHASGARVFGQQNVEAMEAFVTLATLAGLPTYTRMGYAGPNRFGGGPVWQATLRRYKTTAKEHVEHRAVSRAPLPRPLPITHYRGRLWSAVIDHPAVVVRRRGLVFAVGSALSSTAGQS